jgi:hypothetical protein
VLLDGEGRLSDALRGGLDGASRADPERPRQWSLGPLLA